MGGEYQKQQKDLAPEVVFVQSGENVVYNMVSVLWPAR